MMVLTILKWLGIVIGAFVFLLLLSGVIALFAATIILTIKGEFPGLEEDEPSDGDHEA